MMIWVAQIRKVYAAVMHLHKLATGEGLTKGVRDSEYQWHIVFLLHIKTLVVLSKRFNDVIAVADNLLCGSRADCICVSKIVSRRLYPAQEGFCFFSAVRKSMFKRSPKMILVELRLAQDFNRVIE